MTRERRPNQKARAAGETAQASLGVMRKRVAMPQHTPQEKGSNPATNTNAVSFMRGMRGDEAVRFLSVNSVQKQPNATNAAH
jgi:hypothetical protein